MRLAKCFSTTFKFFISLITCMRVCTSLCEYTQVGMQVPVERKYQIPCHWTWVPWKNGKCSYLPSHHRNPDFLCFFIMIHLLLHLLLFSFMLLESFLESSCQYLEVFYLCFPLVASNLLMKIPICNITVSGLVTFLLLYQIPEIIN